MSCRTCGAELPADAMFCGECGGSTAAPPPTRPAPPTAVVLVAEAEQPDGGAAPTPDDGRPTRPDAAGPPPRQTRPMQPTQPTPEAAPTDAPSPSFILRFSTGDVARVSGTGLIGRRPTPQPAESFDHLVAIHDPGLSVSKTHLEFGAHEGELWISDRFSGNGTVIRRQESRAVRCEPGRRYLAPRGSRIEIGEQGFTIE